MLSDIATPGPAARGRTRRERDGSHEYGRRWGWRAGVGYALAAITALPILWLLVTALKPASETFSMSLGPWTLDNFGYVLTRIPMPRYLLNSAIVSIAVTFIALVFHSMAAYALARLRFRGSALMFNLIVATLMVSLPVILVPLFLIVRAIGLIDNLWGIIVPGIFNAFGIFLLRQNFLGIPRELEEAATIDGCGYWGRYWHVVLPLGRPILVSLGILFFLANWNAFMWPKTILSTQELWMVQQGLASMQGQYGSDWNYITAAAMIIALPTMIMFFFGQRALVNSIKTSGLK